MKHQSQKRLFWFFFAIAALIAAGAERPESKRDPTNLFSDPKVAELAQAASEGNVERLDALLAQGVEVNSRGAEGGTPLIYVIATGGSIKGFQRLLERGADPNLQTERGYSAVSNAARRNECEWLKSVLAHGGDPNLRSRPDSRFTGNYLPTPIYDAIRARNVKTARLLIKAGADLNARDSAGWTPLMSAAVLNSFDVMYVLLEAGADFRAKDPMGYTVSWYILDKRIDPKSEVFKSRQKCIEFMEKKGVDFEKEGLKNADISRQIEERLKRSAATPANTGTMNCKPSQ